MRITIISLLFLTLSGANIFSQILPSKPGYPRQYTNEEWEARGKVKITALSVGGVVLTGVVAKVILDNFEKTAERLMDRGKQTGDALLSHLGDEIKIATRNLNYLLGNQINDVFDKLDPRVRNILHSFNTAIQEYNPDRIHRVADLFALELEDHLSPILVDKKDFYIQAIEGLTVYDRNSDFILKIRGIGFGFDNSKRKYKTRVVVNKDTIPNNSIFKDHDKEIRIMIPNSYIKPHFQATDVVQLPVTFTSIIDKKNSWWKFWKPRWTTATYNVDFRLILLPKEAGEIKIRQVLTKQILGEKEERTETSWTPPSCPNACFWEDRKKVAENQRITRVVLDHNNVAHCNWSYSTRGGRGPDYSILDGGREVVVKRKYDHSDPGCIITYYIYYKTFEAIYPEKKHNMKLKYGDRIVIDLDPDNKNGNFEISGSTITNQNIYISDAAPSNPLGPLEYLGTSQQGGRYRVEFLLSTE